MRAIIALVLLTCSAVAFSSNKCYIQKPNISSVEMWGNVTTRPTMEGYM